jgi:hypothetical protein
MIRVIKYCGLSRERHSLRKSAFQTSDLAGGKMDDED